MDTKTIDTYNQKAKKYDEETSDFWDKFPKTFLNKFANMVSRKILDVGSGPGRDGLILQNLGLDVICLDASKAMIKFCQKRGLKTKLGDFDKIPFKDKYFDGVWAYTSLLHVKKSEIIKPLQEIKRVLKNNGIFGLGLIEGKTEEYRENIGKNMPRLFSYYSRKEIEKILAENEFEILYFEIFKPKTRNYLNFIARKI